jgi:four helix bundle protein
MTNSFKNLKVWQLAREVANVIYKETALLPDSEKYGLMPQMRRCCVSILSNLAEGSGRHSKKEFLHFISIAKGSCKELEAQIIICEDLGYLKDTKILNTKVEEINKMLAGLAKSLKITETVN